MARAWITVDGNDAAANVAYQLSEIIAIYPITPSSAMGESADAWAAAGRPNLWGVVPTVAEMQSEGGAAGAVHGALQTGALATTFTASQGLLLMIPNMFKIAGELTPAVIHVSARAIATHALSIFGDHSDVMAVRTTGWAMLASGSVQEAQDFAAIAHVATLASRVPFLHFFDGFRTSHEVAKIRGLDADDLRALVPDALVEAHRARALTPDRPVLRGSAQNPDVFFQGREAGAPYYDACASEVQEVMDRFAGITGRQYRLFEYVGEPDADRVVVAMGSAAGALEETVKALGAQGERVGLVKVRLFRPFHAGRFVHALPRTTRMIGVLDRTKEPGSAGEPLYQDVVTALDDEIAQGCGRFRQRPRVIGGRYGLGSKEFTPAMAKAVFDELCERTPRRRFTVGIMDDVSFSSLDYDRSFSTEPDTVVRAILYGLGSDGTVGAAKNTIKIIGDETEFFAQGYFVYDSKKSGSTTASHLRFGPRPIQSSYLIDRAAFVACHQWELLERVDVLEHAADGAIFLLNSPYGPADVWGRLPGRVRKQILEKHLKLYVIDATSVAQATGMGRRVNTVLQTCFFALAGVLPRQEAIAAIKQATQKTYGAKGAAVVEQNFAAIDAALERLAEVSIPGDDPIDPDAPVSDWSGAPAFVCSVTSELIAGHGDDLPVSALPVDGTFPVDTARWEKRNLAEAIPIWHASTCIQCNKCVIVCPHTAIRVKAYDPAALAAAPPTFKAVDYKGHEYAGMKYTIQVAPEDCTGCEICVEVCPAKDRQTGVRALEMAPQRPLRAPERENFQFFLDLPEADRTTAKPGSVKGSQFLQPLFEFSGACAGCGETPYVKLVTQLFGDRMVVANATGCSSIYGGNLPTTPWTTDDEGRGPAWANSLFEDNAEFGYGMRLTIDAHAAQARELLRELAPLVGDELAGAILASRQETEAEIHDQRDRVVALRAALHEICAQDLEHRDHREHRDISSGICGHDLEHRDHREHRDVSSGICGHDLEHRDHREHRDISSGICGHDPEHRDHREHRDISSRICGHDLEHRDHREHREHDFKHKAHREHRESLSVPTPPTPNDPVVPVPVLNPPVIPVTPVLKTPVDAVTPVLRTPVVPVSPVLKTPVDPVTPVLDTPVVPVIPLARRLLSLTDYLVKKSVWIIGGDGWAYDIGYGGLDHVLASGANVNVLVLDTEVYSNTGGQMSKATPRAAVAKFAAAGKPRAKKDLGLLAMTYGSIYVAQIALGANDTQTVKALLEAEAYDGPSLVIAYSHCIAHGIEIKKGLEQQSRAVQCGHWPLYRFDPRAAAAGRSPLTIDSKPPRIAFTDYAYAESRYRMLTTLDRASAERLAEQAQKDVDFRWRLYQQLAALHRDAVGGSADGR